MEGEGLKNRKQCKTWTLPTTVIFIDETRFNLHIQRNFGRSLKGTPARGTVPTGRGTVSILGAIFEAGVIDISLKKPQAATAVKKRKGNGRV